MFDSMKSSPCQVALLSCPEYHRGHVKAAIDSLCRALSFVPGYGSLVLLKPNLLSGTRRDGLACTHPQFVAAVAEWFIDHGARVRIGDSPAFGTARMVMGACGIREAVKGLPVRMVNFTRSQARTLAGGAAIGLATEALGCDLLVNLPRVKAHSQLLVTLAVKNLFGTVVGVRKPLWHMRSGGCPGQFSGLILDLLGVLPAGITLVDGIVAMEGEGPMAGSAYPLKVVAGGCSPVAVDAALLAVLGIDPLQSPIAREALRRDMAGARIEDLAWPLRTARDLAVRDFRVPGSLKPIRFGGVQVLRGGLRRILEMIRPEK